ncbi:inositol-pentakisphosphate 2-kinase [Chrysoperla carnea]|uniref:inositol-pentakisphosphate 2-kinase n=1 Tax=Chrysoperla carnea TaxID=189513 RepID=UPI001D06F6D5|nr:inositol-pentakisphosphate 2-kinase [Chrysoperla carnea]
MENHSSIDLKNMDWHYRGEGNMNLVIALNNNKILRITKTTKNDHKIECANKLNYKKFYDYLFPLLHNYIQEQQIVYINEEDMKILEQQLEKYRPKHRLHKHLQYGEVILSPDYTFLSKKNQNQLNKNVFCVELKLKQGWIPISDRTVKCTYCLHQYYKLSLGQILKVSKYCPLNIFSGNYLRMKHALKALLDHPQNNLQIFKNGQIVYANDYTEMQLIKTFQEIFLSENHQIVSDSVLKIYPNLNEWDLIKIESEIQNDESIKSILIDYLMFSTFRDCSIMLTFTLIDQNNQLQQPLEDLQSKILLNNGLLFETNIGITDLDPKTLSSLKKHWIQMNAALEAYKTLSAKSLDI